MELARLLLRKDYCWVQTQANSHTSSWKDSQISLNFVSLSCFPPFVSLSESSRSQSLEGLPQASLLLECNHLVRNHEINLFLHNSIFFIIPDLAGHFPSVICHLLFCFFSDFLQAFEKVFSALVSFPLLPLLTKLFKGWETKSNLFHITQILLDHPLRLQPFIRYESPHLRINLDTWPRSWFLKMINMKRWYNDSLILRATLGVEGYYMW